MYIGGIQNGSRITANIKKMRQSDDVWKLPNGLCVGVRRGVGVLSSPTRKERDRTWSTKKVTSGIFGRKRHPPPLVGYSGFRSGIPRRNHPPPAPPWPEGLPVVVVKVLQPRPVDEVVPHVRCPPARGGGRVNHSGGMTGGK